MKEFEDIVLNKVNFTMELSGSQKRALVALLEWRRSPDKKRHVTLGGYAGTGKTTLIAFFRKELSVPGKKIRVAFCSYTGRAARNLKTILDKTGARRSGDTVSTIHGLIYTPVESPEGRIIGWRKKENLKRDLIVVDEASMVDGGIWKDLLSFKIPVIAVGDHGQLPPVNGRFDLMSSPDITLEEIHRQAAGSPIIRISERARKTGRVPPGEYGEGVAKYLRDDPDAGERSGELLENFNSDTMVLCGYNSTRTKINAFVRAALGFECPGPLPGDRVICLRNNHEKGIFNGMLGTIINVETESSEWYAADIKMDDLKKPYSGLIYAPQFGAKAAFNFSGERRLTLRGDLFDFGYALTVHKAQGGQARRVIMFEERFPRMDDDSWKRWLYTGVTRAEDELYLFGR